MSAVDGPLPYVIDGLRADLATVIARAERAEAEADRLRHVHDNAWAILGAADGESLVEASIRVRAHAKRAEAKATSHRKIGWTLLGDGYAAGVEAAAKQLEEAANVQEKDALDDLHRQNVAELNGANRPMTCTNINSYDAAQIEALREAAGRVRALVRKGAT